MAKTFAVKEALWKMLPDRVAVSLQFWRSQGKLPNLDDPTSFSEKLQVRKLYSRDRRFPAFADKAKVKQLMSEIIGPEHLIPTLWVGREIDRVDFARFQRPFVIKPTHGCGEVIFVRDGQGIDWKAVRDRCREWLCTTYGAKTREWLYQHIERQIIIEPMIGDGDVPPADLKFFVFHGVVRMIQVDVQRFSDTRERAIFDRDWNRLPVGFSYPDTRKQIERPHHLAEMIKMAEAVGAEFDFVRVDLYETNDQVYFGEATFYPASGYAKFRPSEFDAELGSFWTLTLQEDTAPRGVFSGLVPGG
jgi:hypothetical protein